MIIGNDILSAPSKAEKQSVKNAMDQIKLFFEEECNQEVLYELGLIENCVPSSRQSDANPTQPPQRITAPTQPYQRRFYEFRIGSKDMRKPSRPSWNYPEAKNPGFVFGFVLLNSKKNIREYYGENFPERFRNTYNNFVRMVNEERKEFHSYDEERMHEAVRACSNEWSSVCHSASDTYDVNQLEYSAFHGMRDVVLAKIAFYSSQGN